MGWKIQILAFGQWLPANHKYYKTKEQAESAARILVREMLGGNTHLCRVISGGHDGFF